MIDKDSPCTASITPDDRGGITVALNVPAYEGFANFTLRAERDGDGDWVVFLPWPDPDSDQVPELVLLPEGFEAVNGLVYIGAPDVPREE